MALIDDLTPRGIANACAALGYTFDTEYYDQQGHGVHPIDASRRPGTTLSFIFLPPDWTENDSYDTFDTPLACWKAALQHAIDNGLTNEELNPMTQLYPSNDIGAGYGKFAARDYAQRHSGSAFPEKGDLIEALIRDILLHGQQEGLTLRELMVRTSNAVRAAIQPVPGAGNAPAVEISINGETTDVLFGLLEAPRVIAEANGCEVIYDAVKSGWRFIDEELIVDERAWASPYLAYRAACDRFAEKLTEDQVADIQAFDACMSADSTLGFR